MKTLKGVLGGYTPKGEGERKFVEKHVGKSKPAPYPAKNDSKLFSATNVKMSNRETPSNHGYNPGDDENVYEQSTNKGTEMRELPPHIRNIVQTVVESRSAKNPMPGSHPGKAANDEITTIVHGTRSVITGTGQELNPNGYHVISRKEIKNGKRSGHQHLGTWGNKADAMKDAAKYKADGDDVMVMVPKGKK